MDDYIFPGLFLAADSASKDAQKIVMHCARLNSLLLIAGAAVSEWYKESSAGAICGALLLLASLFLYIYQEKSGLQAQWYKARALAESVKTSTWRFMMGADPFHSADEHICFGKFRQVLRELLDDNKTIGDCLSGDWAAKDQITPEMLNLRNDIFDKKREFYLHDRIDDQRNWYAKKAKSNKQSSQRWFVFLCCLYAAAIICSITHVKMPAAKFLPVAAGCTIGWVQLKRFSELSTAYSLTAHEIGIIKAGFLEVGDATTLSNFVSDAENAFSREHTQWAARRDHL